MPKLNQINAMVTGRKSETEKAVTELYKLLQKDALFNGFERAYKPNDEEHGERLPPESQKVQQQARQLIQQARAKWTKLWDLTLTQDVGNQAARADIVVDGKTILKDVPVTNLLFLDKQVNDVETFISKLPTPDPAEEWTHDPTTGLLRSKPGQSVRTKKEPTRFEKAPATKEHPAQVEILYIDTPVGAWTKTQFSGSLTVDDKNAILARLRKLKDAIKVAREQANMLEIEPRKGGDPLFDYILGK
jgi:hypothetical protein